ncbi:MAG: SRPBCC family protein [Actinomycetota bacterium]|nr:SRPBCC family protein [Actinomycetota bacterium]
MELNNEFEVAAPIDRVWAIINDVETIAPCLPGAQLQEIVGDEYRGVVKVKVGPITAQYKGTAVFLELDSGASRVVIRAEGRDTRGAGNVSADIAAQLEEVDGGTRVSVVTDLKVTGKVAQFGRGVMADVSKKLMDQFAESLSALIADGSDEDSLRPPVPNSPVFERDVEEIVEEARVIDGPEVDPVDLLGTAGVPLLRRLVPVVIVVMVVVLVVIAITL